MNGFEEVGMLLDGGTHVTHPKSPIYHETHKTFKGLKPERDKP